MKPIAYRVTAYMQQAAFGYIIVTNPDGDDIYNPLSELQIESLLDEALYAMAGKSHSMWAKPRLLSGEYHGLNRV